MQMLTVADSTDLFVKCVGCFQEPLCRRFRMLLLILNISLSVFDTVTDWYVWVTVKNEGLDHPLLKLTDVWVWLWFLFTLLGTLTAVIVVINEISLMMSLLCFKGEADNILCNVCTICGFNYVTMSELLALINLCVEDLPLQVMSLLIDGIGYTCHHPMLTDSDRSKIVIAVFVSSLASILDVGWCLVRLSTRLFIVYCSVKARNRATSLSYTEDNFLYANDLDGGKCLYVSFFMIPHFIGGLIFNVLTFLLSLGAFVVSVSILNNSGLIPNYNRELGVYNNFADPKWLSDVSNISNAGMNISLDEVPGCTLNIYYDRDEKELDYKLLVYGTSQAQDNKYTYCRKLYNDLFLGHNTTSGEV